MSMFQSSVLKSYSQDEVLVATRFAQYQKYKEKIEFIKSVKEEKYQEGFLKDIFENCLGYTLDSSNPNDFNLEREKKNETDSKKADGVIYLNNEVVGVIELKGQDTKNLDKVQQQAFWYLTQHSKAKYVIISNFDELRFYFDKSTAYEKFSLFNLDYEDFKKLHLLLSYESIKEETPLKIKEKTANFEAHISKELYKDFSNFRTHLFQNIIKNNPDIENSILLRLTQKLCDRIIFILFAEDRGLLQPNTIKEIREEFNNQKFTDYKLYDIYKFYFNAINEGNEKLGIPKYNGGLFSTDTELDSLIIDSENLDMEAQKLSDYDFESEVSVNILGHIFEQSLTDLEEIQANIDNTEFDKTKTKRKKDGVFYTPEYITKYIVDNTLGKMCIEKREELNLTNVISPKNPKKLNKTEQQIKDNLEIYKEWLFNLKILDPACGSGAFLNQALEYLIKEHSQLQNDLALMGDLFSSYQVEESVLEHNLYGVDINEDAVEIAKLSLWLRTAKKGRPLTVLANKIKCGNSLISDKNVVDNAFVWEEEFKEVFESGGFDIVIGNPPYIKENVNKEAFKNLKLNKYYQGKMDLWYFFPCLSLDLVKENALISFIAPNNWITNDGASKVRNKILSDSQIKEFIDFGDYKVFEDAGIQTMIFILKKTTDNLKYISNISKLVDKKVSISEIELFLQKIDNYKFINFNCNIEKEKFYDKTISFTNIEISKLLQKIEKNKNFTIDGRNEIFSGIDFPQDFLSKKSKEVLGNEFDIGDGVFVLSNQEKKSLNLNENELSLIKPFYTTSELEKYWGNKENKYWTIYTNSSFKNEDSMNNYPNLKKHLDKFKSIITSENKPYGLNRARDEVNFLNDKIIVKRKCPNNPVFTFVDFDCFFNRTFMIIKSDRINLKYLTSLLNSNLFRFWLLHMGKMQGDIFQVDKQPLLNLPIKIIEENEQEPFINLIDKILNSKEKISKYEKHFDSLNAVDKIEIKEEIEKLENIVKQSINEIDNMVYKLYGLTDEEIKIIEDI